MIKWIQSNNLQFKIDLVELFLEHRIDFIATCRKNKIDIKMVLHEFMSTILNSNLIKSDHIFE